MNEGKLLDTIFKPRELVKQLRKRIPSIDAEWNFSSCRPNETSECLFWEFTREIPSIKQWVRKLRSSCAEKTFDGYYQAYYSQTTMGWNPERVPKTFNGKFYFAPEWPDDAYLSVERRERCRRMNHRQTTAENIPSDIAQVWPVFAKLYLQNSFSENLRRAIQETGKPTIQHKEGNYAEAIFNIRWDLPDKQLKEGFADWLKENRPKGTHTTRRGEGQSFIKKHQTALRNLAAWRLLQKYHLDCPTAEALTSEQGKSLYSGQDNWIAAKREADKRLKSMADFATGRS